MNALLQLSKYVGALFAMVLCLGLLTRSDIKLFEGQESSIISSLLPGDEKAVASMETTPSAPELPVNYRHESPTHQVELPRSSTPRASQATALPVADRASRPRARLDLDEWIALNLA